MKRTSTLVFAAAMLVVGAATPSAALGRFDTVHVACDTSALINAINSANAHGGGTLQLARRCTYHLTRAYADQNGLPPITTRITVKGNDSTVQRDTGNLRIFEVDAPDGSLTAYDLTIKGGSPASGVYGSGVHVQRGAELRRVDCTVTGNTAARGGGGIANFGLTRLTHTAVTGNSTVGAGGGVYSVGKLSIDQNSRLKSNQASDGGALQMYGGTARIDDTTIDGNSSTSSGGGVGLVSADLELDDSAITNNTTTTYGGGLLNGGKAVLRDVRIEGNSTTNSVGFAGGGGIYNAVQLEGDHLTVQGNVTASAGGGIYADYGSATIRDSRISHNRASTLGGGFVNSRIATLTRTTVSDNTVTSTSGRGAGIYNSESLVLDEVRVTGNRATGASSQGGGLYNSLAAIEAPGTLQLIKTRVTRNSAGTAGGVRTAEQFTVFRDSAVADNTPTNRAGSAVSPVYHCTD